MSWPSESFVNLSKCYYLCIGPPALEATQGVQIGHAWNQWLRFGAAVAPPAIVQHTGRADGSGPLDPLCGPRLVHVAAPWRRRLLL